MTLRTLLEAGYLKPHRLNSVDETNRPDDVTLAFALDSGYLVPFKVLIYSLCRQGSLLDCPVAVYSDDASLYDDPVVKLVTDKPRLLDPIQREELHELARTRVRRPERADWNRGTFLKWAIFEEQVTSRLLFMDVDMLCLSPLEPLLSPVRSADLAVAPQFNASIEKIGTKRRSQKAIEAILSDLVLGNFQGAHRTQINSGMMLVNSRLLTSDFYNHLVGRSHNEVMINEQSHLSALFKSGEYSLEMVPVTFNFQERYLAYLPGSKGARALEAIKVLHFAGLGKPWKIGSHRSRESQSLWFRNFFEVCSETKLLSADLQQNMFARKPEVSQNAKPAVRPFVSARYWEDRYAKGGNSGKGSYGDFAKFKAGILNAFVAEQGIEDVLEIGSGDGNQLLLADYPKYYGFDVSDTAIEKCKSIFAGDSSKSFQRLGELGSQQADLAMSLDVIYHLIEDDVFDRHMKQLFKASKRFVVIYASNVDSTLEDRKHAHVRHRKFTDWIDANEPGWQLVNLIENQTSAIANFFFYRNVESHSKPRLHAPEAGRLTNS